MCQLEKHSGKLRYKQLESMIEQEVTRNEEEKSLDQVLRELNKNEVSRMEQDYIRNIIEKSTEIQNRYEVEIMHGIAKELKSIRGTKLKTCDDVVLASCLAATSMALYRCRGFWPSKTQLVSYCLLVARKSNNKGRLLEILTGEGKSCVIAMVAATLALLGWKVDVVTSSPVLRPTRCQRMAEFLRIIGTFSRVVIFQKL